MPDLSTRYLGLSLGSPLVASSSPLTGDLDGLRRLEDAGAAAVVLPSLFEEELTSEALEIDRMLELGAGVSGEALDYFPVLPSYRTGRDHYLELVAAARGALDIPVVASLNGVTRGGWLEHAKLIEQAGAQALEINPYLVAADPDVAATEIERRDCDLVAHLHQAVSIPVSVKLSPFFTALAHTARELLAAGADGLTLFNRFYQPDLDLETLAVEPRRELSEPAELRLPLRWIAILHGKVQLSLAASTGIHSGADVAKVLLAGADVAMLASALLRNGPDHLRRVQSELLEWLIEQEIESVAAVRGSVSQGCVPDPASFERANYLKALRSYASRYGA